MNQFADWRESEMLNGFLFSEIESSLAVEGIRSTRAQIEKLNKVDYDDLTETNDIIIKNMLLGYEFVKNNDITEENIFKLYSLLSKRCLKGDEQLLPGYKYRHDEVSIVDAVKVVVDKGINWKLLPKLMNELMVYINQEKPTKNIFLPPMSFIFTWFTSILILITMVEWLELCHFGIILSMHHL